MAVSDREPGPTRGVYSIAIAAELVGVGIQTLRLYESRGLVDPARSTGGTRRYSEADVDVLRRVVALLAEGVNLAGARRIIQLEDDNHVLRALLGGADGIDDSDGARSRDSVAQGNTKRTPRG